MLNLIKTILLPFAVLMINIHTNAQPQGNSKPNIIIILADDQGWGDLGFTGNKTVSTPHINKLSKNGIVLNRFFVSPVCSPTRAELLTGRYHVRGSVSGTSNGTERLDLDESTIADAFKKNGYTTGVFGKWHNGGQAPYHPNSRGFQEFYGFCFGHSGNYFNPILEHNGLPIKGDGYVTDDLTNHGISFMEKNRDKPFLIYFPFNTPHSPMQVPDEYWNNYKNKTLVQTGSQLKKENINHTKAALAMTENIDWNVGRIMKKLKELKLVENTIVIYFSDNGPNGFRWNGNMKGIKGSTDEGGVRSPFIIQWKNHLQKGKVLNQITSVMDIFPTLVDIAGIENHQVKPFDGISLKTLLYNQVDKNLQDRMIVSHWNRKTSLRTQDFRLSNENELYDMNLDPDQKTDVKNKFSEIYLNLNKQKKDWENNILVEMPLTDKRPLIVGHPSLEMTMLPASEGEGKGNIVRSNRFPNSSYFKQWRTKEDKVIWDIEVEEDGEFEVEIYYACSEGNVGSEMRLMFNGNEIISKILRSNDVETKGMENDRVTREESYVKDFIPMKFGNLRLKKGKGNLELSALILKKIDDLEFNLVTLKRMK